MLALAVSVYYGRHENPQNAPAQARHQDSSASIPVANTSIPVKKSSVPPDDVALALLNQGQMIAAGWVLFANDHADAAPIDINTLVPAYITEMPVVPEDAGPGVQWTIHDANGAYDPVANPDMGDMPVFAFAPFTSPAVCDAISKAAKGLPTRGIFHIKGSPIHGIWNAMGGGMFNNSRFDCVDETTPETVIHRVVYKIQ